jgi:diacylglycerol kinase family enzyme
MNPASRSGKGRLLWNAWLEDLKSYNIDFETFVTKSIDECAELAREAGDFSAAIAVGGDGTVNAVLNGIAENPDQKLQVGVLYSGTSPDFCAFHGIDTTPETAVKSLIEGKYKKIDLAEIKYTKFNQEIKTAYFACSCNIGLGKDVADGANRLRKYLGDTFGTCAALTKTILKGKRYDFKIRIGSELHEIPDANHLAIIKNPLIASGLKLNLDLMPDDQKLGVWGVSGFSRLGMLKLLPQFYSGEAASPGKGIFSCVTNNELEVIEPPGLAIEFDGDSRGFLPVKIKISDKQITLRGVSK